MQMERARRDLVLVPSGFTPCCIHDPLLHSIIRLLFLSPYPFSPFCSHPSFHPFPRPHHRRRNFRSVMLSSLISFQLQVLFQNWLPSPGYWPNYSKGNALDSTSGKHLLMHIDLLLEAGDMRSTTTPRPRHLPGRGSLDWYDTALLIHLDLFLCGKVVKLFRRVNSRRALHLLAARQHLGLGRRALQHLDLRNEIDCLVNKTFLLLHVH